MTDNTKKNIKRWIISSIITFLTGFALVMYNEIDSVTLESFKDGSLLGIIFVGIRSGVKAILELFLMSRKK